MSPCIIWPGPINTLGYGRYWTGGKYGKWNPAHRAVYEAARGPIPDALPLDHLCRVTACVNPDHLEPVTNRENILRGIGFAAVNARKTHCPYGHPYDEANTYRSIRRHRVCGTCRRDRYQRSKAS